MSASDRVARHTGCAHEPLGTVRDSGNQQRRRNNVTWKRPDARLRVVKFRLREVPEETRLTSGVRPVVLFEGHCG